MIGTDITESLYDVGSNCKYGLQRVMKNQLVAMQCVWLDTMMI